MKNIFIIFLLFLLATFTFSLNDWRINKKCPEGTQIGCAPLGRKSVCRCAQKCKEDEYIQCGLITLSMISCSCHKRFTTKKTSK